MGKGRFLGEFEQVVLLALARLGDRAYGMAIRQEIERRTAREPAIGAVYSALDRMERKGYVVPRAGEPTAERGGKAKRFYRLSTAGVEALERSRRMLNRLWEDVELDPESRGAR